MNSANNRRVVITGMGTINPLGDTLDEYYKNLIAGKSGVKRWKSLDLSHTECKIGGDLGDYDCQATLDRLKASMSDGLYKKIRKLFKTATFSGRTAVLSALMGYIEAGLLEKGIDPFSTSIIVAGHNLNSNYLLRNSIQFLAEPEYIDPLCGVEAIDPNVPALITEVLGLHGAAFTIGGACASGNLALRDGFRDIISGEYERSVVTGALFDMSAADIHASAIINAVVLKPEFQETPEKASRPFDTKRDGFVYSHGTGTMILENLETARKRGARIYAELVGIRASSNACHLPTPSSHMQGKLIAD
ncbi:MAG: beta-ketoacyl synthase N-terminal-like domain-containing protein, partial [Spirochaetota bacterium]